MKFSLPILIAAASLILSPVAAFAQQVDVGPGGVSVHGDRHGDRHRSEHHHVEKKVDHHDSHHGDRHETVVVKERHGGDRH